VLLKKIFHLAEESFRHNHVRNQTDFHFYTQLPVMFGVPKYSTILEQIAKSKNIHIHYQHKMNKIDKTTQTVYFQTNDGKEISSHYDLLHIVPPQRPFEVNAKSLLANNNGFIDVDPYTLQSTKYENIFSLGDACSTPNAKTAAAVFSQTPIVIQNLKQIINHDNVKKI